MLDDERERRMSAYRMKRRLNRIIELRRMVESLDEALKLMHSFNGDGGYSTAERTEADEIARHLAHARIQAVTLSELLEQGAQTP